jgi:cell wall-associated NlpC family hydrolase
MSLSDQLAQVPGAEDLAALVAKLEQVRPDAVRKLANGWRSNSGGVGTHLAGVGESVSEVGAAWTGESATAFGQYMEKYASAGKQVQSGLRTSASALDGAASAIDTAKKDASDACSKLIAWWGAQPKPTSREAQTTLDEQATKLAAAAKGEVQAAIDRAKGPIDQAAGVIRGQAPLLEESFKIPLATGQPFVPRPGHKVHWEGVALAGSSGGQGGRTNLAGSGASAGYGGGGGGGATGSPYQPGDATGTAIVNAARAQLGKPYVFGANGPSAFDCSGLVYYCLNQAGIKIGDNTAPGYEASGTPISAAEARPGDIVFFSKPGEGTYHCGIYIGNGQMIVAPHTGDVVKIQAVSAIGATVTYRRFAVNP